MSTDNQYRLFNVDSMLEELGDQRFDGAHIDLFVASLAFRNFDFVARRLPFVIESVTYDPNTWDALVKSASERYWVRDKSEAVVTYLQNEHCGCIRTYRFQGKPKAMDIKGQEGWVTLPTTKALYTQLDTMAASSIFNAWHAWMTKTTQEPASLAEGRFSNTTVGRSLIISGVGSCIACAAPAVASARTTIGIAAESATLIQAPVCAEHLEAARAEPNVLRFLGKLFSLSLDLPTLIRSDSIPDELIPDVHSLVSKELGGNVGRSEKRRRGWHLTILLPDGWHWLLRLNSLTDYAYMLYKPGEKKEVYRADSAPHHPDLPFFPDHEHSKPDRKKDVSSPSFLYGNPFFDLKRLRDVGNQHINQAI